MINYGTLHFPCTISCTTKGCFCTIFSTSWTWSAKFWKSLGRCHLWSLILSFCHGISCFLSGAGLWVHYIHCSLPKACCIHLWVGCTLWLSQYLRLQDQEYGNNLLCFVALPWDDLPGNILIHSANAKSVLGTQPELLTTKLRAFCMLDWLSKWVTSLVLQNAFRDWLRI